MNEVLVSKKKARVITGIFYFISGIITATWASRIPDIQQKLQLSDGELGLVLFSLPIGLFIAMPISARLVAKYGSANLIPVSSILFVGLLCFLGFSNGVWQLCASLFLYGLARNFFNITLNTHSIEVQQLYEKPIIVTFHGLWSVACLCAAGLGTFMIANNVATEWHFLLVAFLGLLVCFWFRKYKLYDRPPEATKKPLFVKPDKYLLLLGLIAFCTMLCEGTTFDWSINYYDKVVGAEKSNTTFGYTSFIIAMSIGRLTGDRIVARLGATTMLVINGLLVATGFLIIVLFPTLIPSTIGFLLVGFGNSTIVPVIYSMAGKSTKMLPSYALTSVTMIGFLGFLLGPLIVGSISETFGMQWAFVVTLVLGVCISLLSLVVKNIKG
jgi:MFS family permease